MDYSCDGSSMDGTNNEIHHYSYGICNDALSHFAIVFSALIHDAGKFDVDSYGGSSVVAS